MKNHILKVKLRASLARYKRKSSQGVTVKGVDNIKVRFSKCCNPVPGDEITGYITRGRGVSIHRTDCPNIAHIEDRERFIEVSWNTDEKENIQLKYKYKQ